MLLTIHFLHPEFLYGLGILIIPIILHLFSLKKYKKVYFSNFSFLEALQQQKKNSSRLKKWLLLLLRLSVLGCIVLAFATPYVRPENKPAFQSGTEIVIYADNSFSMSNTGSQSNLLEEARNYLFDITESYPPGTGFRLLTNEAPDDVVLSREQMASALGKIRLSPASKTLSRVCREAAELCGHRPHTLFIISDFQKINCDFQQVTRDSVQELVLLLLKPENKANLYIRDVRFEQAFHKKNRSDKIRICVANASDREFHNIPVSLTINGKKKSIENADLPPHGETVLEINYLNADEGFCQGVAEIADFPIVFDNRFFFCYEAGKNARILYLWQEKENPCFGKLFSDTTAFHFTSLPARQAANLNPAHYDLVIADGLRTSSSGFESLLEEYLIQGGNLFFLPGASSVEAPNRFLQKIHAPLFGEADTTTEISRIETQASLFRDVFEAETSEARLPYIHRFYRLSTPAGNEKLLSDKRGNVLLAARSLGKGNLYVSAFGFEPENSDMVYHPLFVPLLVNMAVQVNSALRTSYTLHQQPQVTISNKYYKENLPLQIRKDDRSFELIPSLRKDFSGDLIMANANLIEEAGHYEVVQEGQVIDMLAWNYDRKESQPEYCPEEELKKYFPEARIENIRSANLDHNSELVKEIVLHDNNRYLTFWFLLAAIAALLFEQFVWKRKLN